MKNYIGLKLGLPPCLGNFFSLGREIKFLIFPTLYWAYLIQPTPTIRLS